MILVAARGNEGLLITSSTLQGINFVQLRFGMYQFLKIAIGPEKEAGNKAARASAALCGWSISIRGYITTAKSAKKLINAKGT